MPELKDDVDVNKILAEAAKSVGTDTYNHLKEKFLGKWYENKTKKDFGFPASIILAKEIYGIAKATSFKVLKECVGSDHWALNYVKVGMYISGLSDKGEREKIDAQKENIRKNKGLRPLNIVRMGSTGAINGVVNYLDELRKKGYSKDSIVEEFNRIIHDWEKITIFVDKNHDKETIKSRINEKILAKTPLFFIFSYGADANQIAMYSISELRNAGLIEPKDYLFDPYPHFDGVGTKVYMWTFELCIGRVDIDAIQTNNTLKAGP